MEIAIGKRLSFVIREIIGKIEVDFWYNAESANTFFPPILMIHGMFGGGWYFNDWAKFLCDKGFAVYVIKGLHEGEDLRKVDFFTYLEKSTKVAEEICAIRKNKIMLIGHSMGGLIAQKIAETKPDLVAGIALVASAPPKGIPAMSWRVARAMAKHLIPLTFNLPFRIDKKSTFELILNWLGDEDRKEQIFQKFVPESSKVAKQLAFSQVPVDEKKVICKILVVSGFYDRLLSYKVQIRIANKYSGYCRSAYDSCLTGHMPMLDRQSSIVIENIYRWIESCKFK